MWDPEMVWRATGRERLCRIVVRRAPGKENRGALVARGIRAEAALGRSGIARHKREGDGRTPTGRFRLVAVYYRPDRVGRPPTALPVSVIRPNLGWCDDPADRRYNRPIRLPYPAHHERLWRSDRLYDVVVVLDFNLARPRPGAGSAIFLHIADPELAPTEGCIAVGESDMRRLLARAGPHTIVDVR
jgi:L,D-peptidoglycan transpeptidase YkuD (ErfK/YbiS/YcfS/YnhG family)